MSQSTMEPSQGLWGGGVNPYGVVYKKVGMWMFILSDALTFSVLLFAYTYLRISSPNWPLPFHFSSIIFSTVMTGCLLSSSLTMVLAVHHSAHGNRKKTVLWILATMVGGAAFMILHGIEWANLVAEGMTFKSNPWGDGMFGGTFFTITGLHMFHVFSGLCYLAVIAWGFGKKRFNADDVETCGLYWHFVDLVWMFVFPLIYLMSVHPGE